MEITLKAVFNWMGILGHRIWDFKMRSREGLFPSRHTMVSKCLSKGQSPEDSISERKHDLQNIIGTLSCCGQRSSTACFGTNLQRKHKSFSMAGRSTKIFGSYPCVASSSKDLCSESSGLDSSSSSHSSAIQADFTKRSLIQLIDAHPPPTAPLY